MGDASRSISPLPAHVASQIKSSTTIPSIDSVVLGMIANSLDAAANKIDVSFNCTRGTVVVEDDGRGIPPKEFGESGGLGKLYHTSKYNSPSATNGRAGTFLASVAALSVLTITSHHCDHIQHSTLILHHSRPAARLIPAPSHQHLSNREHGTRVTVQDLFGNLPVRVKQRAVESTEGEPLKRFEGLRRQTVALLLAWHSPVSVSIKSVESNREIHIRNNTNRRSSESEKSQLAKNLDPSLVCGILSQAGYIEPFDWPFWIKTSARTPFIVIKGVMSLRPAPSKQIQFISLGLQPVNAEMGNNVLYDEINSLFASSRFGCQEDLLDNEELITTEKSKDRRFKQDRFTNKQRKGGGKGVDRWPMFYIRIELQDSESFSERDFGLLGESTLTSLQRVLRAMVTGFLDENHFGPRSRPKVRGPEASRVGEESVGSTDPTKPCRNVRASNERKSDQQEDTFGSWGRMKSGARVKSSAVSLPCASSTSKPAKGYDISVPQVTRCNKPKDDHHALETKGTNGFESTFLNDEQMIDWTNPVSGATVLVNARTGLVSNSAAQRTLSLSSITRQQNEPSHGKITRVDLTYDSSKANPWSKNLLMKWINPVFRATDEAIPQVSLEGPSPTTSDILLGRRHRCSDVDIQKAFTQSSTSFSAKLSKAALQNAEIVDQVDQKFILISMSEGPAAMEMGQPSQKLLVLVDQHAADERIRVEGLLAELALNPMCLARPLTFEISSHEKALLNRQIPFFTNWGITYYVNNMTDARKCTLAIQTLPAVIAERCRVEPKALIDMIRGEAWQREELGTKTKSLDVFHGLQDASELKDKTWLARLSSCPRGLINMLNSRACRSAIMFNDKLTKVECHTLVRRLGECAFPFQCAHGRPSMIPLVGVGTAVESIERKPSEGSNSGTASLDMTFGEAWKRWKREVDCPPVP